MNKIDGTRILTSEVIQSSGEMRKCLRTEEWEEWGGSKMYPISRLCQTFNRGNYKYITDKVFCHLEACPMYLCKRTAKTRGTYATIQIVT